MQFLWLMSYILPRQAQLLSSKPVLNVVLGSNTKHSQTFLNRNVSIIKNMY